MRSFWARAVFVRVTRFCSFLGLAQIFSYKIRSHFLIQYSPIIGAVFEKKIRKFYLVKFFRRAFQSRQIHPKILIFIDNWRFFPWKIIICCCARHPVLGKSLLWWNSRWILENEESAKKKFTPCRAVKIDIFSTFCSLGGLETLNRPTTPPGAWCVGLIDESCPRRWPPTSEAASTTSLSSSASMAFGAFLKATLSSAPQFLNQSRLNGERGEAGKKAPKRARDGTGGRPRPRTSPKVEIDVERQAKVKKIFEDDDRTSKCGQATWDWPPFSSAFSSFLFRRRFSQIPARDLLAAFCPPLRPFLRFKLFWPSTSSKRWWRQPRRASTRTRSVDQSNTSCAGLSCWSIKGKKLRKRQFLPLISSI